MLLDCDGPVSIECLIAATSTGELPKPNVIVQRRASGNCHVSWFLGAPVHRGELAGWKPQYALARVAEFYRQRVEADPDYTGVLTLNPMHSGHRGAFRTWWGRRDPYLVGQTRSVLAGRAGRGHTVWLAGADAEADGDRAQRRPIPGFDAGERQASQLGQGCWSWRSTKS